MMCMHICVYTLVLALFVDESLHRVSARLEMIEVICSYRCQHFQVGTQFCSVLRKAQPCAAVNSCIYMRYVSGSLHGIIFSSLIPHPPASSQAQNSYTAVITIPLTSIDAYKPNIP